MAVDYRASFQASLIRGLQGMRQKIITNPTLSLNEEQLQRSWTLLNFALEIPVDADFIEPILWPIVHELLSALIPKMEASGYWPQWVDMLEKSISWSVTQQDKVAEAAFKSQLGVLAQLSGQLDRAKEMLTQSKELYKALHMDTEVAIALNWLGYVARLQHDYNLADDYIDEALSLLADDALERELSYFVLGTVAYNRQQWQQAESFFRLSLALCEQVEDRHKIAKRLRDLGPVLRKQKRHQEAMECYQRAIHLFEQVGDSYHCAITKMNLGNIYPSAKAASALDLYQQAKSIFITMQDKRHLAMLYNNQAFVYYELKQWSDAELACFASITQYEQIGDIDNWADTMDGLGLIYYQQNKQKQARQTFQKALQKLIESKSENTDLIDLITKHLDKCIFLENESETPEEE